MYQSIKSANAEIEALKLAAQNSENKLRSFFESSSVVHLLIDTELTLIDFNRAASTFVKKSYGVDIQPGLLVTSFMHHEHLDMFMKHYATALSGVPVRTERQFGYGKVKIDWFLSYEPAWDGDGKILGMSFNAIDITEKRANETKIVSQYHSLKEIAYIQSHQLRRPVTNIMGLMNVFKADGNKISEEGMLMLQKAVAELETQMLLIEEQVRK